MGPPTDEALMELFCTGDERAFDALFERRAPDVQAFLRRMVRDPALADDLLQVTFLSVVRSRDRFQPGAQFAPWLFSIAANAARDALRRRGRTSGHEPLLDEQVAAEPMPQSDPALAKQLNLALDALPVNQREVVVMHHVLGWTFEDMATALHSTSGALRIRAHRGMLRLREALGHLREDD